MPLALARIGLLALFLVVPAAAFAQGGASGSIIGIVTDQVGTPLRGIKISARSDTNIGGAKTAYTTDEGTFIIVGLSPGVFEVTASAPKMKTFLMKNIQVGVNAAAEVNAVMEVETVTEEVKVIEKAPIISTTTANVKDVYDEEFIDQLPVDVRTSAESIISNTAPGAVNTGVRTFRVRGGATDQNEMQVEGFRMNGQSTTLRALAAMEVQTAGYGAENASTPGGVVNMVTKSGSNKFEFDANGFAQDEKLTFFRQPDEVRTGRQFYYLLNPNFSGPIIKDRLWYFVNLEGRRELSTQGGDPQGILPDLPSWAYGNFRGSTKITWQVTPRNKLISYNSWDYRYFHNQQQSYSDYFERDAQRRQEDMNWFAGLIWETLLADNVFVKSQAGLQQFHNQVGPQMCRYQPTACEHIPAIRQTFPRQITLQNSTSNRQSVRDAFQFINTLEWFPSSRALGQHSVKLRNDFYTETQENADSVPGDRIYQLNGQVPDRVTYYYANDPRIEPERYGYFVRTASAWKNVLSLSDQMRLTRYFTITPGIGATTARATTFTGDSPVDAMAITPHISAAWDATHDGRTVLRSSFNNYVDVNALAIARHQVGSQVSQECRWNEEAQGYDRDCRFSGGASRNTIGLPCGATGVDIDGSPCKDRLRIPRTWEYTVGAEREVLQGVALGSDLVYRLYTRPYETFETNRIWNGSGTAVASEGGFRNGRAETVNDLQTSDKVKRRYVGVTGRLNKREGALKLQVSYTWSRTEGNVNDGRDNAFGRNAPRDYYYLYGYMPIDRRHHFRISGTYQWAKWLINGVFVEYYSGRPASRRFRNDETGGFDDYRARIGFNPGGDINSPDDDRIFRTGDVVRMNLQTRVNLRPLTGVNAEVFADLLNVMNQRTMASIASENDGDPRWGLPDGRLDPMRLRLGFRYKY